MNCAQLSGVIESPPAMINDGEGIRFILRANCPAPKSHKRTTSTFIPCSVFDATPEQQHILLGQNHRRYRVELTGRLARTMFRDESTHEFFNVEVIVNPNGLLLQRLR